MQPGDAYAISYLQPGDVGAALDNRSYDLVAGNHRRFASRQFGLDHVKIRTGDAARASVNQHLPGARPRRFRIREYQRTCID
jgi:hypothetical protein